MKHTNDLLSRLVRLGLLLGLALALAPAPLFSGVVSNYGKLPLSFEANHGQVADPVQFLSRGSGYTLFLTPTEAVLSLRTAGAPGAKGQEGKMAGPDFQLPAPGRSAVLRLKLSGASPAPQMTGQDELPGKTNYLIGNDPTRWRTNIPTYGKVRYRGVYSGIDLVYYGHERQLECDFVVAPGADPNRIMLSLQGADRVELDAEGNLALDTAAGQLRLHKPLVYQETGGARWEIAGGYVLKGKNQVGFRLAAYDRDRPLVIDPVLSYATYLGGSGQDWPSGIAVDAAGNAYVAGYTPSTDFPTTSGAFRRSLSGALDVFVAKLNAAGSALVYSTYIGGSENDVAFALAVDAAGNAYLTGFTASMDFPITPNAFRDLSANYGTWDVFVTKLDATGAGLLYSTALVGVSDASAREGEAIAVDHLGNAYVTGLTYSRNFPITPGAFQPVHGNAALPNDGFDCDGFFVKIDTNASGAASLVYATYLGGSSKDRGTGIALDAAGNAYVSGFSFSPEFPTTAGAFSRTLNGPSDAFVAKIDSHASGAASLVYSTYLGGSGAEYDDYLHVAVGLDAAANAYVAGTTTLPDFPTTPGVFDCCFGSVIQKGYVAKLGGSGQLLYATYLGWHPNAPSAIAVTAAGEVHVLGVVGYPFFPAVADTFGPLWGGDVYVLTLDPTGSHITDASILGGSGWESTIGNTIALDAAGAVYITGYTNSADFPATAGVFQPTYHGGGDVLVAKIRGQAPPLGPANVWIGLTNSDDVGIRFDLRAEVYRNGTQLIGAGELASVRGGSSGFNNAHEYSIPLMPVGTESLVPGDILSVTLWVRNACSGSGKNSGRARLWYGDATANSRFDATVTEPETNFLLPGFALGTVAGGGTRQTIDVAAGAKCSPFKPFGAWSRTLP